MSRGVNVLPKMGGGIVRECNCPEDELSRGNCPEGNCPTLIISHVFTKIGLQYRPYIMLNINRAISYVG